MVTPSEQHTPQSALHPVPGLHCLDVVLCTVHRPDLPALLTYIHSRHVVHMYTIKTSLHDMGFRREHRYSGMSVSKMSGERCVGLYYTRSGGRGNAHTANIAPEAGFEHTLHILGRSS